MTQYLKSLYLCICLLGGFISCQTNESITQDEEIQTIMEGISNQAGQEKNPYLTAGDKTYIIGTQDGNFPDLGGHTPGEMGGVWNHLIKLLDGFWVKMTDNKGNSCWLENAIQYTNYPLEVNLSTLLYLIIVSVSIVSNFAHKEKMVLLLPIPSKMYRIQSKRSFLILSQKQICCLYGHPGQSG